YNIPLRKETLKVPPFKKANKAVKAVREFISKHMKSENIAVGKYLNLQIWDHGAKNPPHHVKVNAIKDDKGKVFVELFDAPKEKPKAEEKKKEAKKEEKVVKEAEFKEKAEEKPEEKIEKKVEEAKEEKAEEAKKIEEEEIKELKKEHPKHTPKMPAKPRMQETHPTAPRSV
ncbi:60S ribosomal protein L31, partial [Candidatus Woesearchaeota archaeon]|nr:60S ribosomal protein L31 [Candidatus Woesearchaeota archaeon]